MNLCTCFLLFRIFAYANSSPLHTTEEDTDDMDVEVDSSVKLHIGNNDKNEKRTTANDKNDKRTTANDKNDKRTIADDKTSGREIGSPTSETFTDFVQEVIKILNTYEDNTFKDFIQILDNDIKRYHSKGHRYHELMANDELRSVIDKTFDSIREKPVSFIKDNINEVAENIKNNRYNKNVKRLLNYINSMYREDDREKFQKVLKDLKVFGSRNHEKSEKELKKIVRYGIWAIIFNHYTNSTDLNDKKRKGLQEEIARFLKHIKETPAPRFKTKVIRHKPAFSELNKNYLNLKNVNIKDQETKKDKRRSVLKPNTNEERSDDKETTVESSQEESDSQQLILTFQSTFESSGQMNEGNSEELSSDTTSDESIQGSFSELSHGPQRKLNTQPYDTLYIEDFYTSTETPAITYRSDMDSKLVEGLSIEEAADKLPATRPRIKSRQRHQASAYPAKKRKIISRNARNSQTPSRHLSDDDQNNLSYRRHLRRSIPPPIPKEELSIEVFERERRKRERVLANSYSFVKNNSIQHGLKDFVKRRRNLQKKINELKKIYENIQRSKANVTTYNGDNIKVIKDDIGVKDKLQIDQIKVQEIEDTTVVNERQSNTHIARVQTENNEIEDFIFRNKANLFIKYLEDNNREAYKSDDRHTLKRKKAKTATIKETTIATTTQTTGTEYKYSTNSMTTKLVDLKSVKIPVFIELRATAKKKNENAETTYKTIKNIENEI